MKLLGIGGKHTNLKLYFATVTEYPFFQSIINIQNMPLKLTGTLYLLCHGPGYLLKLQNKTGCSRKNKSLSSYTYWSNLGLHCHVLSCILVRPLVLSLTDKQDFPVDLHLNRVFKNQNNSLKCYMTSSP